MLFRSASGSLEGDDRLSKNHCDNKNSQPSFTTPETTSTHEEEVRLLVDVEVTCTGRGVSWRGRPDDAVDSSPE